MSSSDTAASRWKSLARLALLLAGAALLVWIVVTVGWPAIRANLAAIGAWFPALVLLYAVAQAAFALAWWEVIEPRPPAAFLPQLFAVYLAGDTVNYLVPTSVAGEPLKAHLLRDVIDLPRGIASLTVHKHADMLAQFLFVASGLAVALTLYDIPRAVAWAAAGTVAALGFFFVVLSWALWNGTFSPLLRKLAGISFLEDRLAPYHGAAERLDQRIRDFYARHRGRFVASVVWSLVGWCGGFVETWIVLRLLGGRADAATAFVIETLAMVLNAIFIWMPGRLGTAEGVRVGVFLLLGLPAAPGAAYSLVRRAREVLWAVPGALVLATRGRQTAARPEAA